MADMANTDNIVGGKRFRILRSKTATTYNWDVISFWTRAKDVMLENINPPMNVEAYLSEMNFKINSKLTNHDVLLDSLSSMVNNSNNTNNNINTNINTLMNNINNINSELSNFDGSISLLNNSSFKNRRFEYLGEVENGNPASNNVFSFTARHIIDNIPVNSFLKQETYVFWVGNFGRLSRYLMSPVYLPSDFILGEWNMTEIELPRGTIQLATNSTQRTTVRDSGVDISTAIIKVGLVNAPTSGYSCKVYRLF